MADLVSSTSIRAVLLDIEGTTTPIAFVSDVLFPYARKHLRRHIEQRAASPEYAALVDRLREEHEADRRAGASPPPWDDRTREARLASSAAYCEWLIDRELAALTQGGPPARKSTSLKTIQGHVWEEGYAQGELRGDVFADVRPALERWHARGLAVGIFSSGSVLAQQLLFRHSSAGDLTPFICAYFDTTTGAKREAASYGRIAGTMNVSPDTIVFVSDIVPELDAAREAGMQTRVSVRPGVAPQPARGHAEIRTFDELLS